MLKSLLGGKAMGVRQIVRRIPLRAAAVGFALAVVLVGIGAGAVSYTSGAGFCMSCHEMRVVGEQGWMRSKHYHNPNGVVAGCTDCHVPHAIVPKLWVKARDGTQDIAVHLLGTSDPSRMDWDRLAATARGKIYDSSCRRCHSNLTPTGGSLKMVEAHRKYGRTPDAETCLGCHKEEFHGEFRNLLPWSGEVRLAGGER
jgi:nitrate/TMAO reductase-like tetraheme cytochrome c subunit